MAFLKSLGLTAYESRGVLILLPLLGISGLLIFGLGKPRSDPAFLEEADSLIRSGHPETSVNVDESETDTLFHFDPNTVTLEELCRLGFDLRTAASIVKYRNSGKVFRAPEDLAMCYGVTLQQYLELAPYIKIGEQYRIRERSRTYAGSYGHNTAMEEKTVRADCPFDPNEMDEEGFVKLGFTAAQARTIINYRNSIGGFTSAEQFGKCYAVSSDALHALLPFMVLEDAGTDPEETVQIPTRENATVFPVEINSADSAALRAVSGIGEVLVVRIIEYRDRLGGFARPEQLAEVQGMIAANYERILQQIRVDSCTISKIDINFAPHKDLVVRLERHPYTDSRMIRKLLSVRQLKGGWSNTRELVEDKIMTEREAEKLAPYLLFREIETDKT